MTSLRPRMPRIDAQPIVDLRSGERVCEELLLRMVTSTGEVIPPARFLPQAERTGAITRLDRFVVRVAACAAARGRRVAVNVSGRTLCDALFLDTVERAIVINQTPPGMLTFELTETSAVRGMATASRFAERLSSRGCIIALDDFGARHGGLAYLERLHVTTIKIDKRFVRDVATNSCSRAVIGWIVHLAWALDLTTVAKGIEDQRTLEVLRDLGVDQGQGFHIGRPKPMTPLRAVS